MEFEKVAQKTERHTEKQIMKEYTKNIKATDGNYAKMQKFNNWLKTRRNVKRNKFESKGSKLVSLKATRW